MREDRFVPSSYDPCVFNKQGPDSAEVTMLMHVDDLFIESNSNDNHTRSDKYKEIKINTGKVVDYIGMTFDFIVPRQASITMVNCRRYILSECEMWPLRATPAASTFFNIRDALNATYEEVQFFRTFVAKLLYIAKRAKPEFLDAVGYMT